MSRIGGGREGLARDRMSLLAGTVAVLAKAAKAATGHRPNDRCGVPCNPYVYVSCNSIDKRAGAVEIGEGSVELSMSL